MELAYEIEKCKITWIIKHDYIGHVFFDSLAARFFLNALNKDKADEDELPLKRTKYTIESMMRLSVMDSQNLMNY